MITLRTIYIACAVLLSVSVTAQRNLKYENVCKEASELPAEKAYALYSEFLSINPASVRSNLYFRLGNLSSEMMRRTDPIAKNTEFLQLVLASKLYYTYSLEFLNENEAKRDKDLFTDITFTDKKQIVSDISTHIEQKIQINNEFVKGTTSVTNAYENMVNSYYTAARIYKSITDNNLTENSIFINWQSNEPYINRVKDVYDSVKIYLEQYREALVDFQIKSYSANYRFAKINEYRVDGYTPSNFENESDELWDYGAWADEKLNHYKTAIAPVKEKARQAVTSLDAAIEELLEGRMPNAFDTDEKLINNLANIDSENTSTIKDKYAVIDFLKFALDERNSPNGHNPFVKADYYKTLSEKYKKTENYKSDEMSQVARVFYKSAENYKQYIILNQNTYRKTAFLMNKKQEIPFYYSSGFYRASNAGFITKSILPDNNGGCYISGSSVNSQGFAVAFVAYSPDMKNIAWLKTEDVLKMLYDDCAVSLTLTDEGCNALITSKNVSDPDLTSQTIVSFDSKGNEINKITLPEKNLPIGRNIYFDRLNKNTMLIFYGDNEDWFRNNTSLVLQVINSQNEQLLKTKVKLNGDVSAVYPIGGGYIVFGNYTSIETPQGEFKTENLKSDFYSFVTDKTGNVIKTTVYNNSQSAFIVDVKTTSDKTFTLLGQKGDIRKNYATPYTPDGAALIIVTDNTGGVIFKSE